jgi:nicotinamide-nucleotide amidase
MLLKLPKKIVKILKKKKLKISFAESCTGGMLASQITSISGASEVFKLGMVTYSNQAKIDILHVPKEIVKKYGAVSKECCEIMAKNIQKIGKSHIGISITGVAGPKGGTLKKPIGLVYVGISKNSIFKFKKFLFNKKLSRAEIQKKTCSKTFKLIQQLI